MFFIGHENEDLLGYDLGGSSSKNGGHTVNEEDTCNNVKWCDHEAVLLHG